MSKVDTQITNLEFFRLHVSEGHPLALDAAGAIATQAFFDHQVPFTERVPRQSLAVAHQRARERAEGMADSGVSFYSVLPSLGEVL